MVFYLFSKSGMKNMKEIWMPSFLNKKTLNIPFKK